MAFVFNIQDEYLGELVLTLVHSRLKLFVPPSFRPDQYTLHSYCVNVAIPEVSFSQIFRWQPHSSNLYVDKDDVVQSLTLIANDVTGKVF